MALKTSIPHETTYFSNGVSFDVTGVKTVLGKGVSMAPLCNFMVIPKERQSANICSNQTITANTPMTFNTAITTTFNSNLVALLDCQRSIRIQANISLASDITFIVTGYDARGKQIVENITVQSGSADQESGKTYLMIQSIVPTSANNVGTRTFHVGMMDRIGLPFFIQNDSDVVLFYWGSGNNVVTTPNSITPGAQWRDNGNITATSRDANGYVALPTYNSDGIRLLRVLYYCYGADSELVSNITNQVSVASRSPFVPTTWALTYTHIRKNTNNTFYVYPNITPYDLCGPQYPADSAFISAYQMALAS